MSKRKHTVQDVREALDGVVEENPERQDRRAAAGLSSCRYVEHGDCACLAAAVLRRLGYSLGRLKALDQAASGDPVHIRVSGLHKDFEPLAFELLCFLQRENDWGWTWGRVRRDALSISDFWAHHPKYRYRGREWLAETRALNAGDFEETT